MRNEESSEHDRHDGERQVQEKDRAPSDHVDQPTAEHGTHGADNGARRGPHPNRASTFLAAEGLAQDRQTVRQQDGAAHALNRATDEEDERTRRERAERGSKREDRDAEDQEPSAAEAVARGSAQKQKGADR